MIVRLRLSCCILFTVFTIVSCSQSRHHPGNLIPHETFVQLYADLLVAGEAEHFSAADTSGNRAKKAIVDSILAKYHVTEPSVRQTVLEYSKDLQSWKKFYDDVIKRLEEMQRGEQAKKKS